MKNSISEYSPENPLVEEIKKLKRQVREAKFVQPPTIKNSVDASADLTLASGSLAKFRLTLTSADDQVLPTWPPEIAVQRSQTDLQSDTYPHGSNWSDAEMGNFHVEYFLNVGETDNINIVCSVVIKNKTASSFNIRLIVKWRFFNRGVS